jgi:hypothetical protein
MLTAGPPMSSKSDSPRVGLTRSVGGSKKSGTSSHPLESITLQSRLCRISRELHSQAPRHIEELKSLAVVRRDLDNVLLPHHLEVLPVVELQYGRTQRLDQVGTLECELPAVRAPVGIRVVVEIRGCRMREHLWSLLNPTLGRLTGISDHNGRSKRLSAYWMSTRCR